MPSTLEHHVRAWLEAERHFEEAARACAAAIAADASTIDRALGDLDARRREAVDALRAMTAAAEARGHHSPL